MNDDPEFHFEVSTAEIEAALKRKDYQWLVENVFTPALVQFLVKQNTTALINNPRPRSRRPVTRHRQTRRSDRFRP